MKKIFSEVYTMLEKYWIYLFLTGVLIGAMVAFTEHMHS